MYVTIFKVPETVLPNTVFVETKDGITLPFPRKEAMSMKKTDISNLGDILSLHTSRPDDVRGVAITTFLGTDNIIYAVSTDKPRYAVGAYIVPLYRDEPVEKDTYGVLFSDVPESGTVIKYDDRTYVVFDNITKVYHLPNVTIKDLHIDVISI